MKYTKNTIKELDTKTIDFCCRWVWDSLKRKRIMENTGKTKAQREYAHAANNGTEFAFDMLRALKRYNIDGDIVAEFALLDDDMKE